MPRPLKPTPKKVAPSRSEQTAEVAGLRIIGGTMRGRHLEYSGDSRTRPMKDRVREAVFNLVGTAAGGAHAIDLFAGTGALGLEALSRGALRATFIERHYPTSQLIKKNAAHLGVEDRCEVVFGDAFLWARKSAAGVTGRWLVFCSPPYDFYVSRRQEMLDLLASLWTAAPAGSVFVVEADERLDFGLLPEATHWDVRAYPPARVGIAEKMASSRTPGDAS